MMILSVLPPRNLVAAIAQQRLGRLSRWKGSLRLFSSQTSSTSFPDESGVIHFPIPVLEFMQGADWEDRIALQAKWTNEEKGWQVPVEWKNTPYGVGLFAAADIPTDTILRVGTNGNNLLQFQSIDDIETFCRQGNDDYEARLHYVSDYLWGYSPTNTDEKGYDLTKPREEERFFGMWIPGNGLNHNSTPNTVYRTRKGGTDSGIVLLSIRNIHAGEELFDDYRRHGLAPKWLLEFAKAKNVTLNFADCNDFVGAD